MNKLVVLLTVAMFLSACSNPVRQDSKTVSDYYSNLSGTLKDAKQLNQDTKEKVKLENLELDTDIVKKVKGIKLTETVKYYRVVKVVDGDTIDVNQDGKTERIRMIGINTPESVDPRRPIECFGVEASNVAKKLLTGQEVMLDVDSSQANRDKYGRLLRYVKTKAGLFYNLEIIKLGYAYEYTYIKPYKYQTEFKAAQTLAQNKKLGLWAEGACEQKNISPLVKLNSASSSLNSQCNIKGNINSKKEKIYHLPGCASYNQTIIDAKAGEQWFCNEADAIKAGWRKAGGCL